MARTISSFPGLYMPVLTLIIMYIILQRTPNSIKNKLECSNKSIVLNRMPIDIEVIPVINKIDFLIKTIIFDEINYSSCINL